MIASEDYEQPVLTFFNEESTVKGRNAFVTGNDPFIACLM